MPEANVAVLPIALPEVLAAVEAAGANCTDDVASANVLVWTSWDPSEISAALRATIEWVQLPAAGVEAWVASGLIDGSRTWTSARGAYSDQVAEHALALLFAGVHRVPASVRAETWRREDYRPLCGSTVGIVGAGGIGRRFIALVKPLRCRTIAVNREGNPVEGADETLPRDRLPDLWSNVDHVLVAAPATRDTYHLVDAPQLGAMRTDSWLVNVARGSLVNTDALVVALDAGHIGGAALDVTDPEPLPEDHRLWTHPRAIVTPHIANPPSAFSSSLAEYVGDNVARFQRGEPLAGVISTESGY